MKKPIYAIANCRTVSYARNSRAVEVYAYATMDNLKVVAGREIRLILSVDEAEDLAGLLNSFVAQRKAQADEQ